uniref:Uncharacterized protein n=1 Tax=Arion vulgaris TaxID=1028688 RepID=A0A0B6ZS10_9EUPU
MWILTISHTSGFHAKIRSATSGALATHEFKAGDRKKKKPHINDCVNNLKAIIQASVIT